MLEQEKALEAIETSKADNLPKANDEAETTILTFKNLLVSPLGMLHFSQGKWDQLIELSLFSPQVSLSTAIGSKGCKYLSRAALPRIESMNLNFHAVSQIGVFHLAKAPWGTLKSIDLIRNRIGGKCWPALARANWKNMKSLSLEYNSITGEDLKDLLLAQGQKLSLNLRFNKIDQEKDNLEQFFDNKLCTLVLYSNFF